MTRPPLRLLLAVAAGGAVGAVLRWAVGEALPTAPGFPWATLAVNVLGSGLLAVLPAVATARRRPVAAAALGPGLLGGFTTLSAAAEDTRVLLADGDGALAAAYVVGTLAAALVAVELGRRVTTAPERIRLAAEDGDA